MTIRVEPDALRRLAALCDSHGDKAGQAVDAAGQASFNASSYGLIGGMLVFPAVAAFQGGGLAAINMVPPALELTSAGLRTVAQGFELLDEDIARRGRELGRGIEAGG